MENEEKKSNNNDSNSRRWTGIVLFIFGVLMLLHHIGEAIPAWLFSWQMILIGIGLSIGIRKRFRSWWGEWIIMILVGTFFLLDDYFPTLSIHAFIWPIILMWVGLVFIFKPRSKKKDDFFVKNEFWQQKKQEWEQHYRAYHPSEDEYLDVTTVLSGTKRNILSKDFKGGEIVSVLGGTEINLSQADINGRVVIDSTQVLGGTKLIVPAHWDVRSESVVSVFGGIEDKRILDTTTIDHNKILVLIGTSIFGGIEISSY